MEFNSIFGKRKIQEYESCSEYYYFYKDFCDAVKDGGWIKNGGLDILDLNNKLNTHNFAGRLIIDNEYGRYIEGGINRYALFVEGKFYLEGEDEFSLSDEIIKNEYEESCVIICYTGKHKIKPDILVKNYENFIPLSYHKLNKVFLYDKFIEEKRIPNILLYGELGSGKKKIIYDFFNKIYNYNKKLIKENTFVIDCNVKNGIQIIREELKLF